MENDTTKLLTECNSGIRMGVSAIDDVLGSVENARLKNVLSRSRKKHEALEGETQKMLNKLGSVPQEPDRIVRGMAKVKTSFRLAVDGSDKTVAGLITDGCSMGVKSLSSYLNEYKKASDDAKDVAKRLIALESSLSADLRSYL